MFTTKCTCTILQVLYIKDDWDTSDNIHTSNKQTESCCFKMHSYCRRSWYWSYCPRRRNQTFNGVLMKKQKTSLIPFLLFLGTRLVPGELSTGPLLRWAVAGELGLSGRLHFRLRNRGEGIWWGPFWARGGWYPRTPALFLLQVTPAIAGGPSFPVPEGSPYPLDEPQLKKGRNNTQSNSPHQPALKRTVKMNCEKKSCLIMCELNLAQSSDNDIKVLFIIYGI